MPIEHNSNGENPGAGPGLEPPKMPPPNPGGGPLANHEGPPAVGGSNREMAQQILMNLSAVKETMVRNGLALQWEVDHYFESIMKHLGTI